MNAVPTGSKVPRITGSGLGSRMTDLGFAAGWMMVRALPEFAARNVFDAGARYAGRNGGPDQLRKNLARVIGVAPAEVPDELMRASLLSYARYWRETFRLPTMDHQAVTRQCGELVEGFDDVQAALAAGRGAICALPHSGNWDMCGLWLAQTHGTFTTVAERLKPESLYRRFIDYRESLGFEVIPHSGGERPPYELLTQRIRESRLVALMADRDLTRTGLTVDFFGEPTRMPAGPAKLAVDTGAALFPVHCWYEEGKAPIVRFYPELDCSSGDIGTITQALADIFARHIAAHPADWHMMQPQWLADLSKERRAKLEGT